jgi:L-asparaginase
VQPYECSSVASPLNAQQLPKLAIFTLGGTIASTTTKHSDGRVSPEIDGAALVRAIPQLALSARIDTIEFRRIPSGDLTMADVIELARDIVALGAEYDGVVVTQGTDTLEETAFLLDLLVGSDRPVVVTGAMRNPTMAGADGPANVLAAVQVAASRATAGRGVLVVMNDEMHAARWVRKTHTSSTAAFTSPSTGPIGVVVEGRPRYFGRPSTRPPQITNPVVVVPAVALVRIVLGDDDRVINEIAALGYAGVVVEAFGAGHVPSRMVDALARLASAMPVVLASRTGSGSVLSSTYGFPGSESDLLARGLISAGDLDGLKSRLLLSLLLGAGCDLDEVRTSFHSFVE